MKFMKSNLFFCIVMPFDKIQTIDGSTFEIFFESESPISSAFQNLVILSSTLYSSSVTNEKFERQDRQIFHRPCNSWNVYFANNLFSFFNDQLSYLHRRLITRILFGQMKSLKIRAIDENWKDSEITILQYEQSWGLDSKTSSSKSRSLGNFAESRTVTVCIHKIWPNFRALVENMCHIGFIHNA